VPCGETIEVSSLIDRARDEDQRLLHFELLELRVKKAMHYGVRKGVSGDGSMKMFWMPYRID